MILITCYSNFTIFTKNCQKSRELEEIVCDLRECLVFDDAGIKPIRACGTRWICHKLSAMKRVISKYGAFIGHLSSPLKIVQLDQQIVLS